jgi:hypothetical protein
LDENTSNTIKKKMIEKKIKRINNSRAGIQKCISRRLKEQYRVMSVIVRHLRNETKQISRGIFPKKI